MKKQQLWGGRFKNSVNDDMWRYSKSIQFDYLLAEYDICGSIAHVRMLAHCGYISENELSELKNGLLAVYNAITSNAVKWNMNSEDIHSFVEECLYKNIGSVAGKMHLGRSRNDQVALDFHMYVRNKIYSLVHTLVLISNTCIEKAGEYLDAIIPGYTHMQRAEPVYFSHHLMAYVGMFKRDIQRLQDLWKRVNISPLGAGAFAGSPLPIDNAYTARLLRFDDVYDNSMDAVSDRDFAAELLFCLSLIQMHISKMCEEIILWSSHEFSFVELSDEFCTGSSMMPQKKNPDLAELARGKTGQVYGALTSLLTTLKGLPLSYNRDLQEDKRPVFESVNIVLDTLTLFSQMIHSMKLKKERTELEASSDFSNATEVANYLSKKGVPFREAHEISGQLVLCAISQGVLLKDLSLNQYKTYSAYFERDIFDAIQPKHIIEKHSVKGGTAIKSVRGQITKQKNYISKVIVWMEKHKSTAVISQLIDFTSKG